MIVSISIALALGTVRSAQTTPLTLIDAIQIAESNAFTVKLAKSNLEKLRQKVNEAKGGLGPKVTLGANYTRFDKENSVHFNPTSPPVIVSPIESKQATAALTLPIDIAGNINRGLRASEAAIRSAQETVDATRSDLRRDVRKAYVGVLRARAQLQVAQQTRDDEADRLKNVQIQKDAGTLAQVDVLRQEAATQQSESDLIAANSALELAKQSLNNTLARPIETPVEVAEFQATPEMPQNVGQMIQAAQRTRPEVKSLVDTRIALHEITLATAAGLEPTLNFGINYARNIAAAGFSTRDQQTTGTLTFSFPIFDSGVTRAKIKESREDEVQAKIQQDQLELSISLEVQQAMSNLTNAKQRSDVAVKQLAAAEETYRLAKVKLQAGGGILLEVTDAETALTQARNGVVGARYDYVNAYTDLQRAVGLDDPASAAPTGEIARPAGSHQ